MAEDITKTSKGSKIHHEDPYKSKHMVDVSKAVAESLVKHTIDCKSFDKVTDATDEVGVL